MAHLEYHFSITVETYNEAVLHCLRSLAQYAQAEGRKMISWSGTKRKDWLKNGFCVKFHFSSPQFRDRFCAEAEKLLPRDLWAEKGRSDTDPAPEQEKRSW